MKPVRVRLRARSGEWARYPAIPTTGLSKDFPAIDPRKGAPKLKMPPSAPLSKDLPAIELKNRASPKLKIPPSAPTR
jgi:hypothetical protein